MLQQESRIHRDPNSIIDERIHACLYLLDPATILTSQGFTMADKVILEKLSKRTNVILCLAKSDLVTVKELWRIKDFLRSDLGALKMLDAGLNQIKTNIPFTLINSEVYRENPLVLQESNQGLKGSVHGWMPEMGVMKDDVLILGREYVWGVAQTENPQHCDFMVLRSLLLGESMNDLRAETSECMYEEWRTEKLLENGALDNIAMEKRRSAYSHEE